MCLFGSPGGGCTRIRVNPPRPPTIGVSLIDMDIRKIVLELEAGEERDTGEACADGEDLGVAGCGLLGDLHHAADDDMMMALS